MFDSIVAAFKEVGVDFTKYATKVDFEAVVARVEALEAGDKVLADGLKAL